MRIFYFVVARVFLLGVLRKVRVLAWCFGGVNVVVCVADVVV